jgi:hypothetical protein
MHFRGVKGLLSRPARAAPKPTAHVLPPGQASPGLEMCSPFTSPAVHPSYFSSTADAMPGRATCATASPRRVAHEMGTPRVQGTRS